MSDERKCVRCGMLQRMKDEEICEPCMELLILGIGNTRNEDAWNRFVEAFSDALIRKETGKERIQVSEYVSKKALLEWLDDRRYKSPWIESFRDRLESGAFDVDQTEVQRLLAALEEVYEELKTLHFMVDSDDNIFHEQKKKYLSIIDHVGQSVAGQALSTTTEPTGARREICPGTKAPKGDGNE